MGLIWDDKLHHGAGLGATPEEAVRAAMGFVELRYWRDVPFDWTGWRLRAEAQPPSAELVWFRWEAGQLQRSPEKR